ncbi:MAG: hypothetical protein BWY71_01916 [Planctomycetes bacterium ADurb.Bin412]|nr:MAG: hypothetical protein BWY71_01916 [Planctomycetes bacterium ADurb.Bin412]
MLGPEFQRQAVPEFLEELRNIRHLHLPGFGIDFQQSFHIFFGQVQAGHVDIFQFRNKSDSRLAGVHLAAAPGQNPLQNAEVFPKTGPEVAIVLVLTEPVDMENLRLPAHPHAHPQPMLEVVRHIVAAERQHGHRVAPDFALLAVLSGGPFAGHRRADIHTVRPVVGLINQRGQVGTAAAKDNRGDVDPVMMFDPERMRRTLHKGGCKPAVGMGTFDGIALFVFHPRLPGPALPIQCSFRRRFSIAIFPPDSAVGIEHDVGKDSILFDGGNGAGIGF